jgi:hypothetical protein
MSQLYPFEAKNGIHTGMQAEIRVLVRYASVGKAGHCSLLGAHLDDRVGDFALIEITHQH